MTSLRSRIAALTPAFVRKMVRMAEHYLRRQREWLEVLCELRGASPADHRRLLLSALCGPFTALAQLDGFQPPKLMGDIEVQVPGAGSFAIRAGTDDLIHVLSAREPAVRHQIEALLRPGDTFVDAGANIGFYSLIASCIVGEGGQVWSVEMMPPTAARLRHHVSRNGAANVSIIEAALSDRDGDVLIATSAADKFGQASIVSDAADVSRTIRHEVRTVTLDTALPGSEAIRLMKMDLEGAEYMALCGATNMLERCQNILFESNGRDERIFKLLASKGFSVEVLEGYDYLATRPGVGSDGVRSRG